jgi:hypothetical protein
MRIESFFFIACLIVSVVSKTFPKIPTDFAAVIEYTDPHTNTTYTAAEVLFIFLIQFLSIGISQTTKLKLNTLETEKPMELLSYQKK